MTTVTTEVPVLVVGGGPVGLTLAADLAWRGNECLLVEKRTAPTVHPKATLLGARSMELYRRWGLDDAIYAAALPPEHEYHIVFTTRLSGHELYRFTSPSIHAIRTRDQAALARFREMAWSPYGKTQIGQQALEPVLVDFARAQAPLQLRQGWRCESFEPDGEGVVARLVEVATGREELVRARYLVGCDGGGSMTRKRLGIRYNGRGSMRANVSFYFRSAELSDLHGKGVANLYFVFTPDSFGVLTAINGRDQWNLQHYFLDPAQRTDQLDPEDVLTRAAGKPFAFELLGVEHWRHHQSVARAWRHDAVFLAGDAAHLFVPTGGVGMNTGIGDAIDLSWKLDAVLAGWGGEWLLDSYEAERKPVAIRNSILSANNSDKIDMVMDETPAEIEKDGPRGDQLRAELSRKIRWLSRQFNSAGVHLGYRYVDSPVCVPDGTPEPPDDPTQVAPSTWPGSRAPHAWMADGRSSLDLFGREFTLVRTDPRAEAGGSLAVSAAAARMPLREVLVEDGAVTEVFERRYLLVRPDGHVAWRGDTLPDREAAATAIIDRVRGATEPGPPATTAPRCFAVRRSTSGPVP